MTIQVPLVTRAQEVPLLLHFLQPVFSIWSLSYENNDDNDDNRLLSSWWKSEFLQHEEHMRSGCVVDSQKTREGDHLKLRNLFVNITRLQNVVVDITRLQNVFVNITRLKNVFVNIAKCSWHSESQKRRPSEIDKCKHYKIILTINLERLSHYHLLQDETSWAASFFLMTIKIFSIITSIIINIMINLKTSPRSTLATWAASSSNPRSSKSVKYSGSPTSSDDHDDRWWFRWWWWWWSCSWSW